MREMPPPSLTDLHAFKPPPILVSPRMCHTHVTLNSHARPLVSVQDTRVGVGDWLFELEFEQKDVESTGTPIEIDGPAPPIHVSDAAPLAAPTMAPSR